MAKKYTAQERSRNAQKQLRDRLGRFLRMGGTARYKSGGKTKSGTLLGISGGYAYMLPPIKNATHEPQPYRVPISSLEMFNAKATLKTPEDRKHEKEYLKKITKDFESKLDPERKKELETTRRLVEEARKNKSDVDYYETDSDGVVHLKKNSEIQADPKIQAQVEQVLNSLEDGKSFTIPLEDGFVMVVQKNSGSVSRKVLDTDGTEHSSRSFSGKKSNKEISQEIAKDVARENETEMLPEDIFIDLDGDGLNDISDPFVRPQWQTTTKSSAPSKEDLDSEPSGTTLISEDGNTIYIKTDRRSETRGAQWARYDNSAGGSHELQDEAIYSDDIADGTAYKRPSQAISEEVVPLTPEEVEARKKAEAEKTARKELLAKLNDREKFVTDPRRRGGLSVVDDVLANALPVSAERDSEVLDLLNVPKSDLTTEILDSLPSGKQVVVKNRNGKNSRATKLGKTWYTKKNYKDSATGEDRRTLSSEEVLDGMADVASIRASGPSQRLKDYNDAINSRDRFRAELRGEDVNPRTEDPEETSEAEEYEKITVSGAEALEQYIRENTISDKDPAGTVYEVFDDLSYTKMENGQIVSTDGDVVYNNASEFIEDNPHGKAHLSYSITKPLDSESIPKDAEVPPTIDVTKLPVPVRRNQNRVTPKRDYPDQNELTDIYTIEGTDGVTYPLGSTRTSRNDEIHRLYEKGLIDPETFDPKTLFTLAEGTETGRYYADNEPIRIGDIIEYNTKLREGAWNNKQYIAPVRAIVTGISRGKGDLDIFPLETVYGKTKGQVKDDSGKIIARPVIETSFGPESVLKNGHAVSTVNFNTVKKEGTGEGVREEVNVEGRTSSFDLPDLFTQDAQNLSVGDRVKFRFQSSEYNKDGIPYETVHEGTVVGFNTRNQSLLVQLDNGEVIHPSIKNTTADGSDPLRPSEIQDNLILPEGFRLDSQNRVLSESSARATEDFRDLIGTNGLTMEETFGEAEDAPSVGDSTLNPEGDAVSAPETPTPSEPTPRTPRAPRRNLINSVVSTQQEYDSSIPRYFRDRKETEYASATEKATDWANAPVGSTIRLLGGGFAIKTSSDSWDFRKSSKHLIQRNLSNNQFAKTLEANQDFLDNARTTAPTRKKFLEYNGGRLSDTARPSTRKAPVGSEVEVEGDKLTKTDSGWEGDQGVALSNNQLDALMVNNPEDVKITKVSVSKVVSKDKSVAIQDSIFELNEDGSFSRNDVFSFSPKDTISAEEVDTVAGEMSPDFNMVVKDRKDNTQDSWDDVETLSLDSDGNIILNLDDSAEQTAKKVLSDFASRLDTEAVPPRRIIIDESEHFQTVSAYAKPNPDGGYDLVVNPDGVEEKDIASALADGMRQNTATVQGLTLRQYDENVLKTLVTDEDRSLSYDEILQKLGIRSKRKGSIVTEAFEDVWENGEDANPVHLNIWKRYASDNEMVALFRRENGRDPRSDSELDKYRKKL